MSEKYAIPARTWTFVGDSQVMVYYDGPDGQQTLTTDSRGAILLPAETDQEREVLGGFWMVRPGNVPVRRADDDEPKDLVDFAVGQDGRWAAKVATSNAEPEQPQVTVKQAPAADPAAEQFEQAVSPPDDRVA